MWVYMCGLCHSLYFYRNMHSSLHEFPITTEPAAGKAQSFSPTPITVASKCYLHARTSPGHKLLQEQREHGAPEASWLRNSALESR